MAKAALIELIIIAAASGVIELSALGVRQNLVCGRYFLELRSGLWIVWILIGVPPQR